MTVSMAMGPSYGNQLLTVAVAADDSLEPILITLINIEGTPVGSFPEIREGMEAARETVNATMGGMMGRPVELDSCVHGL
ncbi:MAG: hypothetical protein CM15mP49_16630 [Actinomycetota bacterium]|nr:MAG: hypothetical protein CM15mP49_16630 [Actinomycetota bacterium]